MGQASFAPAKWCPRTACLLCELASTGKDTLDAACRSLDAAHFSNIHSLMDRQDCAMVSPKSAQVKALATLIVRVVDSLPPCSNAKDTYNQQSDSSEKEKGITLARVWRQMSSYLSISA